MSDLGIAIVGAGVHGSRYAEHLLRGDVPGARLAGVCRRDAAEAARWRSRGVRFETDAESLAGAPGVDAVVVASPPGVHRAHAEAALAAGKPLLLEKPVATGPEECARIREAAARARVPVLAGHAHRYNPVAAAFRGLARQAAPLRRLSLSLRHERMAQPWQHLPPGGGALLSVAVHLADLARWITGEEIASVRACEILGEPGEAEGAATALARTSSGILLSLDASIVSPARQGRLEAWGPRGEIEGDLVLHELARREGRTRLPVPLPPPGPGLVPLLRDFLGAVRGGGPGAAATLEDGIAAVEFVSRCRAAAAYSPR